MSIEDINNWKRVNTWTVETKKGSELYSVYNAYGMTNFILEGLKFGKVTVNGKEVGQADDIVGWKYISKPT